MNNAKIAKMICSKNCTYHSKKCHIGCCTYKDVIQMAVLKDKQLEGKLMQIIILAQQGYTSGASDEMILLHCKEVIKEQF